METTIGDAELVIGAAAERNSEVILEAAGRFGNDPVLTGRMARQDVIRTVVTVSHDLAVRTTRRIARVRDGNESPSVADMPEYQHLYDRVFQWALSQRDMRDISRAKLDAMQAQFS